MLIFRVDHGKFINWVAIMYFQLVKELIKWDKCQKNIIERTTKKGCIPFCDSFKSSILEVVSSRKSKIIGEEEISRRAVRGQKEKKK
jgi:hypothetical protein